MLTVTPYIFFTGKGGVGKTTLACATAVALADSGKTVLLVSTDPASNLHDVLDSKVDEEIRAVKGLPKLYAVNINPEKSAENYRSRVINPLVGKLPEEEIKKIREELSGACTTEIASFDEFSRFIAEEENKKYDIVIFDTAPTGHTLRLLELPSAWDEFVDTNPGGASCLGPSSALQSSHSRYKKVLNKLCDARETTVYLVARADMPSLREAARSSDEIKEMGMSNQQLLINGIFKAVDKTDHFAIKIQKMAENQLNQLPTSIIDLPLNSYPLLPYNILGLEKLRSIFDMNLQANLSEESLKSQKIATYNIDDIKSLTNELSKDKTSGLIMTMGKGGVGKTLTAAAIAVLLAQKGHQVLLTTTDPAAHIHFFLDQLKELPPSLSIEQINPKAETEAYIEKIMAHKGKDRSKEDKKLLLEDLKSPCTEEVAVFHAFSKAIQKARRQFVVIDTAPTGHTLLLLDTAGSYHKEIMKKSIGLGRVSTPYMALQDADFAKILLVALPEITPMHEADALQKDLNRAGIKPFAWVINQCLSAVPGIKDPILRSRASAESKVIEQIKESLSDRTYGIPYLPEEQLLPALIDFLEK